jgi:gas vesicle protein
MNKNNVLLGTVLGSLLGSVGAAFIPEEHKDKNWQNHARKMGQKIYEDVSSWGDLGSDATKNFVAGALLGLLVGAGSTALLTPKTGKQLRKNVTNQYQNVADKTQDLIDLIGEYAGRPVVKKVVRKVKDAVSNLSGNEITRTVTRRRSAAKSVTRGNARKTASKSRATSRSRTKTRSRRAR